MEYEHTHSYTSFPGYTRTDTLNVQIALGDPVAETEVTNSRTLWVIEAGALGAQCLGESPIWWGLLLCSHDKHPLSLN